MSAKRHAFLIERGSDWTEEVQYLESDEVTPVDLTGYTVEMIIVDPNTGADFTPDLLLDEDDGLITISMDAAATAALTSLRYNYELQITSSGAIVTRLLEGPIKVSRSLFL